MNERVQSLLTAKKVLVCCGPGGVGKTTVSASLALAAAQLGRRVLIMTIDPSRRLADVLGVSSHPPVPVSVDKTRLASIGIENGSLHAWILDPMVVAEQAVRHAIDDDVEVERFLANPVFRQLSNMTAGMQEYSAMKALHGFVHSGDYDLVVVDTPPARHALDFLDAPSRLAGLFDTRILKLFRASKTGLLGRTASAVIHRTIQTVTSRTFADEFSFFITQFERIFRSFEASASAMRRELQTDSSSFLLITSPSAESLDEAFLFQDKARTLSLPFGGFVLNRSCMRFKDWAFPTAEALGNELTAPTIDSLQRLARVEQQLAARDLEAYRKVCARAGETSVVVDIPLFETSGHDLSGLARVAALL